MRFSVLRRGKDGEMEPKKIEIVSMVKVTYEANDSPLIPKRIIEEYWTPDGRRIGGWDLLNQFPLIKSDDSTAKYSEDK